MYHNNKFIVYSFQQNWLRLAAMLLLILIGSNPLQASASCPTLSQPYNLSVLNNAGTAVSIQWNQVSGADSYTLQTYINGGYQQVSSNTNTATFSGFTAGYYYFNVTAHNSCGNSSSPSAWFGVDMSGVGQCNAPDTPSNLTQSNVTGNSFAANWSVVTNADNYQLQRWNSTSGWSSAGSTVNNSYQFSNLTAGTEYVRVRASNNCGASNYSNYISVPITGENNCPSSLAKATNLLASNITGSAFTINWDQVDNADRYSIQLWVNEAWSTVATTTELSYNLSGLATQSTQYVRIVAKVDCDTNVVSYSSWISVKLENVCPDNLTAPQGLNLTAIGDSSFSAQWSSVADANNYKVQLATNGVWQTIGNQTELSKTFTDLSEGTYQVKVAAVCGSTVSPDSAVESIVISAPQTCNLPDVNGGIDISRYGDSFDDFSVNGNIYVQGSGFNPANYSMKITCQGNYGFAAKATDRNVDNYVPFTYSYSYFGSRPSNVETIQFEVKSGNSVSRKTLSWNLNVGTQQNPVQPSCSDIHIDNDVDGIPDCAEEPGKTFFGMPVYQWGARKGATDVFIEVDYMSKSSSGDHGTQPRREVFDKVKSVFAARGYSLHFDVGNLYGAGPENYNLGGGQAVQYSPWIGLSDWRNEYDGNYPVPGMKNNDAYPGVFSYIPVYFENKPERSRLFYYALFAGSQAAGGEGSSGQAPDYFDYYFYVSLGSPAAATKSRWYLNDSSEKEINRMINSQSSVFMHELGHVLGLSHGGWPDTYPNYEPNFKPNYPSIMNYAYALSGVPYNGNGFTENEMMSDRHYVGVRRDRNAGCMAQLEAKYGAGVSRRNFPGGLESNWQTYHLDYSNGTHSSFSENSFIEANVEGGLDLDCDGNISNISMSYNINYDFVAPNYVTPRLDNMRDYNDWNNIYLYYRHLNYSQDGKFLMAPNIAARQAIEPANVVPGAISSPQSSVVNLSEPPISKSQSESSKLLKTTRPIGVLEVPMPLIEDKK